MPAIAFQTREPGDVVGVSETVAALAARDAPHAIGAAARLAVIEPGLAIRVHDGGVTISGIGKQADALHLWRVALLNERLVSDADPRRADVLRSLLE